MAKVNPRISINKLGEYCEANPTRRKQIVYDSKYPQSFKTSRYSDARDAIKYFLIKEMDEKIIHQTIKKISEKLTKNVYQENDKKSSIESLEILLDSDISKLHDYKYHNFDDNIIMNISGVDISVNPDLLLTKNINSLEHIGAIKIHITKDGLTTESQKIIAAILFKYVENYIIKKDQIADLNMCFSFDIFREQIESSPTSYTRRMNRVEAACEEISLWWNNL